MKRLLFLSCAAIVFFLSACHFSTGYNKDLRSGLSMKYNGFEVRSVFVVDSGNRIMADNKVPINSQIAIVALGLTNFALKDGKVFPGMKLSVTDKKGFAVLDVADLFPGTEGYPPEKASTLRGDITVAQPMRAGETYLVKMGVWDKVKPSNTLDAEINIVVQ